MSTDSQLDLFLVLRHNSHAPSHLESEIASFFSKWQIPHKVFICHYKELNHLLDLATAEYLVITPVELHNPLSEILRLVQALISQPDLDLAFGNRYQAKNQVFLKSKNLRCELDHLYHPLFQQHMKKLFADPLCDTMALRKKFWQQLTDSQKKSVTRFKWTPFFQSLSLEFKARSADIPIYDNGDSPLAMSKWKSRIKLFWMSSLFS